MKKLLDNIPLAAVMIIVSVATSFAVVQTKVSTLEKTADKNEATMEDIKSFKAEQKVVNQNIKEDIGEVKEGMKELLKEIRSLK
jgi:peptidoglycan hydrolase CwlO-like protein